MILSQVKKDFESRGLDWSFWVRTAADERAAMDGCRPCPERGRLVVDFFARFLHHSKGEWAGRPFILLPFQVDDIVLPLFSWLRPDGFRRFKTAAIWVPKKNFKSTFAAGLSLYAMTMDGEAGAEVYLVANEREQAGIVFRECVSMVDASPSLKSRCMITRSTKTIAYPATNSRLVACSSESGTKDGLNSSMVVMDELHEWRDRELYEKLAYSGKARRQPMFVEISTAGCDPDSLGFERYSAAKRIIEGDPDDITTFAYVREAPPDADWSDPAVWKSANPAWGVIIREDDFREEYIKAKNSLHLQNMFRRYLLNQWTTTSVRWIDMEHWDAGEDEFDIESLRGMKCWGGLDIGSTRDTTAISLVFPPTLDDSFTVLSWCFIPADTARAREQFERLPYLEWAQAGYIELTPGNATDQRTIEKKIIALGEMFNIEEIVFDPWNSDRLVQNLREQHGFRMEECRQGYKSMTAPSKAFEKLVLAHRVRHLRNPVQRRHIDATSVTVDPAGNIKPNKEKDKRRIDITVSIIMALSKASLAVEHDECPFYIAEFGA